MLNCPKLQSQINENINTYKFPGIFETLNAELMQRQPKDN